jgi:hypothetical protein
LRKRKNVVPLMNWNFSKKVTQNPPYWISPPFKVFNKLIFIEFLLLLEKQVVEGFLESKICFQCFKYLSLLRFLHFSQRFQKIDGFFLKKNF